MSLVLWIVLGVVLAFIGMLVINYYRLKNAKPVPDNENVIKLNDSNFNQHTKAGLVIVDFWAEWCMPCKLMTPVMNDLAVEHKGKIKVCKLNVDHAKQTASKFKIRGIPSLIIFKNGKEVKRITGVKTKAQINSELRGI